MSTVRDKKMETFEASDPPEKISQQGSRELFDHVGTKAEALHTEPEGPKRIDGEDDDQDEKVVDEIESLCMNCHENVSICDPISKHRRPDHKLNVRWLYREQPACS